MAFRLSLIVIVALFVPSISRGATPLHMPAQVSRAQEWAALHLSKADAPPFSFQLNGQPVAAVLGKWQSQTQAKPLDANRVQSTTTWRDPRGGLSVRMVSVQYADYPMVEWTVYLRNDGSGESALIENLQGIDADVASPAPAGEMALRTVRGSDATPDDYAVGNVPLPRNGKLDFVSAGGRPTDGAAMPYFNLDLGGGSGVSLIIGWPGQWSATFSRPDSSGGVHLRAGQELTHFKLHRGEEVRTPLMVLQFHDGDLVRAQNVWRRWMVDHNLPRVDGKIIDPLIVSCSSYPFNEMLNANEQNQKQFIDGFLDKGFPLKFWWMDAGWYINNGRWENTGTWEVDRKRFPNGLRGIIDHAHQRGIGGIVWFEPERATDGSWLYKTHPEWLLTSEPGGIGNEISLLSWGSSGILGSSTICNPSNRPKAIQTVTFAPHSITMHPGARGERTVMRWTAPVGGQASIEAQFSAADVKTTTDVHVIASGTSLLDGTISVAEKSTTAGVRKKMIVKQGDTIDFVVGYGPNNTYANDSTRVDAVIDIGGKRYDATKDFVATGASAWQYGYIPADAPLNSAGFVKADQDNTHGGGTFYLLNLGNEPARTWLTKHIIDLITSEGIDLYRQDFNIQPLSYWRSADSPDRQGLTENFYVQGYLAYWDALRARFPKMFIDSCASGGRRNDLETLRRSVPLLRSDYEGTATEQQAMTRGLSFWIPYYGNGILWRESTTSTPAERNFYAYFLRSKYAPSMNILADMRRTDLTYDVFKKHVQQLVAIQPSMLGDYYPLTPYSRDDKDWMAWQFHEADAGKGYVQIFRRPAAAETTKTFKLQGLEADAIYQVWDVDHADAPQSKKGEELMNAGLTVPINEQPGAKIYQYAKKG